MGYLRRPEAAFSACYLVLLTAAGWYWLLPTIVRSWFYSSDEYVVVGEIIRFSDLDLRQHFFDMPGTPFIFLVALVWSVFSRIAILVTPGAGGLIEFTYRHLDWLFGLARTTTVLFHGVSVILCFLVVRKVLNTAGACIASLLLMMAPAYASYSAFVRVESTAMCLVLTAVLLTYFGLQHRAETVFWSPRVGDPLVLAGIAAGLAAGVRLYSVFVSLPLLWLILVLAPELPPKPYPRWIRSLSLYGIPLLLLGLAASFFAVRGELAGRPHAAALLAAAGIGMAVLPLLGVCLHWFERTRPLLLALAPTAAIKVGLGVALGVLLGLPTLPSQRRFFFNSVEMYSTTYTDYYRATWSFWKNISFLVNRYVTTAAPDRVSLVLLFAGAALILFLRDRKALPYLATALIFFVSRRLTLMAAQHHIILWLPCYAMTAAYPFARAYSWLVARSFNLKAVNVAFALFFGAAALSLTNGPRVAGTASRQAQIRLDNIAHATSWMNRHLEKDQVAATAFYCFNPDAVYAWMQNLEVPVPRSLLSEHGSVLWWGYRAELAGHAGFLCLTKTDMVAIKTGVDPAKASQTADPYSEPAFRPASSFGTGADQVDVFSFDFRTRTAPGP